ncbi:MULTISPECIES: hypothetical protein [unclassified Pseudomonas]|uniref:hypothetical protein n=1 Tax=unclassified Pseudomonas TaxID=196821 RepID=UPI0015A9804F|nr:MULTISPECIES: hypothetical protein [unclassified Pseudomonas]MCU1737004.1 hypothetical protein [Pseudomonas sp. 20S_6.2_Bac1]
MALLFVVCAINCCTLSLIGDLIDNEPLNARGSDDQDEMAYLYGRLEVDADDRGLEKDRFYFIGDHVLEHFVAKQRYEWFYRAVQEGEISRIHFAHAIWWSMPENFYQVVYAEIVRVHFYNG